MPTLKSNRNQKAFDAIARIAAPILRSSGAKRAAVFGSAARGTMKKGSDVDILVELPPSVSLLDFIGIKLRLEEALRRKVDLVEYSAIKAALRKGIMNDQIPVL